tara:strand:- start:293 stop:484 length:192 start_codon:yes stop_codon:yes gene_type:complete
MSDITIDGTEYKKEEMDNEQIGIVNKLAQIQQSKNNLQSQIVDLDILSDHYVNQFKQLSEKDK